MEPDASALEEAAAPAPTSPPRRQPRPQRGEASVLTIRSRDDQLEISIARVDFSITNRLK